MIRQHSAGATLGDADVQKLLTMLVDIVVYCERKGNVFRVVDCLCGPEAAGDAAVDQARRPTS
jgi:hypothetical protein